MYTPKAFEAIIAYFKALITDTKKVVNSSNDKGRVAINLVKIWAVKVLLPALLVVSVIILIKTYAIYIVLAIFGFSLLVMHFNEREAEQAFWEAEKLENCYSFVGHFIYSSVVNLTAYLPVQSPQDVFSIAHNPSTIDYGNCFVYAYRLLKSTPETIDKDKLSFAAKIFRSLLTTELDRFENEHEDGLTYAGKLRRIELDEIVDMGSYILFKVAYVDNTALHNYLFNKLNPKAKKTSAATTYDEDF